MNHELLIVFENEQVFSGALTYAREFAARTDSRVTFLMLVAMSFSSFDFPGAKRKTLQKIESNTGRLLAQLTEGFIQKGIETSAALRIGDPSQELLKFLADRPSFQAILWGSGQDLPFAGRKKGKHWLCHLAGNLECPLLTVTRRLRERRNFGKIGE
jgi:hypothetical protein